VYEMTKITPSVGAACSAIVLAPSVGQRDGIGVSSVRFSGAVNGGTAGFGRGTGGHSGTAVLGVQIPTATRVRAMADAYVPGAPPRGAPV
jgi:hypothetical protein